MRNYLSITLAIILVVTCSFQKGEKSVSKTYYANGKLRSTTEMENGRKNGKEELYFENGNIFMVQHFKDDMPVDSFYQFDQGKFGAVLIRGHNSMRAHQTMWFADNTVFGESQTKENAVADGLVRIYYKNGKPASVAEYKDGKLNGIQIFYFMNGNVKKIQHYKNGLPIPPSLSFDSIGRSTEFIPSK
jgi:uncharacterized protein